eukprot:ANDGO_07729.mRNA.1 hypothetical protein
MVDVPVILLWDMGSCPHPADSTGPFFRFLHSLGRLVLVRAVGVELLPGYYVDVSSSNPTRQQLVPVQEHHLQADPLPKAGAVCVVVSLNPHHIQQAKNFSFNRRYRLVIISDRDYSEPEINAECVVWPTCIPYRPLSAIAQAAKLAKLSDLDLRMPFRSTDELKDPVIRESFREKFGVIARSVHNCFLPLVPFREAKTTLSHVLAAALFLVQLGLHLDPSANPAHIPIDRDHLLVLLRTAYPTEMLENINVYIEFLQASYVFSGQSSASRILFSTRFTGLQYFLSVVEESLLLASTLSSTPVLSSTSSASLASGLSRQPSNAVGRTLVVSPSPPVSSSFRFSEPVPEPQLSPPTADAPGDYGSYASTPVVLYSSDDDENDLGEEMDLEDGPAGSKDESRARKLGALPARDSTEGPSRFRLAQNISKDVEMLLCSPATADDVSRIYAIALALKKRGYQFSHHAVDAPHVFYMLYLLEREDVGGKVSISELSRIMNEKFLQHRWTKLDSVSKRAIYPDYMRKTIGVVFMSGCASAGVENLRSCVRRGDHPQLDIKNPVTAELIRIIRSGSEVLQKHDDAALKGSTLEALGKPKIPTVVSPNSTMASAAAHATRRSNSPTFPPPTMHDRVHNDTQNGATIGRKRFDLESVESDRAPRPVEGLPTVSRSSPIPVPPSGPPISLIAVEHPGGSNAQDGIVTAPPAKLQKPAPSGALPIQNSGAVVPDVTPASVSADGTSSASADGGHQSPVEYELISKMRKYFGQVLPIVEQIPTETGEQMTDALLIHSIAGVVCLLFCCSMSGIRYMSPDTMSVLVSEAFPTLFPTANAFLAGFEFLASQSVVDQSGNIQIDHGLFKFLNSQVEVIQ